MSAQILPHPYPGGNPGPGRSSCVFAEHPSTTPVAAGKKPSKHLTFRKVPDDLADDPRLKAVKGILIGPIVVVARVLLWHARSKASCWPSDATIAKRAGYSLGQTRRALAALEATGWIRRMKAAYVTLPDGRTIRNGTGRLIVLIWLEAEGVPLDIIRSSDDGAQPGRAPARDPGRASKRDKGDVIVKGETSKGIGDPPERPRPEPPPSQPPRTDATAPARAPESTRVAATSPPAPAIAAATAPAAQEVGPAARPAAPAWSIPAGQWAAWLASDDPILKAEASRKLTMPPPRPEPPQTFPDAIARIGECQTFVPAAAELLAQDLGDRGSWCNYLSKCREVAAGRLPGEILLIAHREGTSPAAIKPGAVFETAYKREKSAYHRRC